MAIKKIGAIIALDGEKEFKQNVTSCNKSLSALKSELSLAKAQYEGQANSLEALTKKHEILSRTLAEHERKEEEISRALENAKENYDKVGKGLEELGRQQRKHETSLESLKEEYRAATERLEAMTESGNSSERAMQKQEAITRNLAARIQEEENALSDVNSALERGERNYQTAGNRIRDWETRLNTARAQTIRVNSAVQQNAAYMREAERATDGCATSIDEFGNRVEEASERTFGFTEGIKNNIGGALVDVVKDGATQAATALLGIESAQKQLQASTGATNAEMKQYETVMDNLYKSNYGEDINDIASSMALVRQYTNEIDPTKIEEMTKNGIAMRDVFDMDLSETIRGVDALMENMGLSSEEAFDLMAKGAQNGLDKSGELADNISEYSQLWGQAGFSAQEMFVILDNGLESGAYNLDKVNDFVKEFTISLADGRIEENLESFSTDTQNLFNQWKIGKATAKDVFYSVINDLSNATNKQEALTLASTTWSALGEDNAMQVITALDDVNHKYDDVHGTMDSINDIKYDTVESRVQELGRKFMMDFAEPIAERALPAIEDGLDFVIDNLDALISVTEGVVAGVATYKGLSMAIGMYEAATGAATAAQSGLNAVMNANPLMLVASLVVAAGTALISFANDAGEASEEVKLLTEENQKLVDSCNSVTEATNDTILEYKDSSAEMRAQGEYARALSGRIDELAKKEKLSNEEKQVMSSYIAELNGLVPDLNLAYDDQTKKLNLTNEEIEKYIENNQKQIEQQAALEYAQELIKKRTELKIEEIKVNEQLSDVQDETNRLLEEENDLVLKGPTGLSALIAGKEDERQSYKDLTEAQEESSQAVEDNKAAQEELEAEIKATQEVLAEYGISIDNLSGSQEAATEVTNQQADAMSNNRTQQEMAAASAQTAAQEIAQTYTDIQTQTAEVLESQMNMFEEFNAGTEISKDKLLENMQSQIDGVTNWAENMETLADRGINEGILTKLAEMGPEGANYVAAFAQMSDDELKKAGEMWTESLDIKSGVEESVSGMMEAYTEALNGGKDRVTAVMGTLGYDTVAGLTEGINANLAKANAAGKDIGDETTKGSKESLQSSSPSKRFMTIGKDVVEGMTIGIRQQQNTAVSAIKNVSNSIVKAAETQLNTRKFLTTGKNIASGIANGINAGRITSIAATKLMCMQIVNEANKSLAQNKFVATGKQIPAGISVGIIAGRGTAVAAGATLAKSVVKAAQNTGSLYNTGYNLSAGMAKGISAGRSAVINAVASLCAAAVSEAKSKLKINSPSKVFEEIGSYTAEGFGVGYERRYADVRRMINESMNFNYAEAGRNFSGFSANNSGNDVAHEILGLLKTYMPLAAEKQVPEIVLDDGTLIGRITPKMMPGINRGLENIKKRNQRGMPG